MSSYPLSRADRDAWIVAQRGPRSTVDPAQPYGYFVEDELAPNGEVVPVATILLTNRECPWRCVMCDLWKNTLTTASKRGAILAQIDFALDRLAPARHIKLYNSGSFFDKGAVPTEDFPAIAARLQPFERVIVESHPALVGPSALELRNLLSGRLEVAMGLETANPEVLSKLNKGMTLQLFSKAASLLRENDIDLRTFILVQPPFSEPSEALQWAQRSLDFAFNVGSAVATLLVTRSGNGAMESLEKSEAFVAPGIRTLEAALEYGVSLGAGRVFADLWNLEPGLASCPACFDSRRSRLAAINLSQTLPSPVHCNVCKAED